MSLDGERVREKEREREAEAEKKNRVTAKPSKMIRQTDKNTDARVSDKRTTKSS